MHAQPPLIINVIILTGITNVCVQLLGDNLKVVVLYISVATDNYTVTYSHRRYIYDKFTIITNRTWCRVWSMTYLAWSLQFGAS